jgi:hypothetical protein
MAPWSTETAASLDMARFVLTKCLYELASNSRALGMDPTNLEKPILDGNQDWERSAYNEGQNLINFLLKVLDMFRQTYHQQGAIYEAKRANDITKSVAKITLLASVFFPISITASIFSMGGEYLPGSRLFWVYWVVTLPLCILVVPTILNSEAMLPDWRNLLVERYRLWKLKGGNRGAFPTSPTLPTKGCGFCAILGLEIDPENYEGQSLLRNRNFSI